MVAFLYCAQARAQNCTLSGYVLDAGSGEPIIGAAVIDKESSMGTVAGNSGNYSISLPAGSRTFVVSALGYAEYVLEADLVTNLVRDIRLQPSFDSISEAVVTASRTVSGSHSSQMSAIEVPLAQIKAIPAIGGEVDVIKALQLLPGVQSGTEGSAGFYVRGGGADENLLLMDGVPLYNVSHLMGFFSVFNADAIKNVTLYKGSFPARFGGHLSSVVDIRMNDGNESEFHGNASIGLISSKFNMEGPIVTGRTTFNVSARRTYLDLLAKPVIAYANKEGYDDRDNYEKYGGGYDFYDLNAKITHRFRGGDRLSLSFYTGDDDAKVSMEDRASGKYSDNTVFNDNTTTDMGWQWGNMVASLRWNHALTPDIYMTAGASFTRYRSALAVSYGSDYITEYQAGQGEKTEEYLSVQYNSHIKDLAANVDFEWRPAPQHDVKFGAIYTEHAFKPGIISMRIKASDSGAPGDNVDFGTTVGDKPMNSHEAAAYIEDNWAPLAWFKANIGVHASLYNVSGRTYWSAEPRISARALITDKLSVKASYSEMSQYIHLLCNSSLALPSDLWVPVTKKVRPMRSRQAAAGVFYDLGPVELSVEGYYKTMDNVLEYKDGASYFGTSTGWEDKVCCGRGWSYGVEFLAQKTTGKTTGWIGYTLSRTMRQFDKPGNIINDGNPFPAKYDRRHDLGITVLHRFSKRFDLSATFVLSSGCCGSLGLETYRAHEIDQYGKDTFDYYDWAGSVDHLPGRNNYRMPAYNRMDVGMNFYRQKKRGTSIWNLSIYNVYNRLNPFMVFPGTKDEFDPVKQEYTYTPVLKELSIFPIIPSFSYTFKF